MDWLSILLRGLRNRFFHYINIAHEDIVQLEVNRKYFGGLMTSGVKKKMTSFLKWFFSLIAITMYVD